MANVEMLNLDSSSLAAALDEIDTLKQRGVPYPPESQALTALDCVEPVEVFEGTTIHLKPSSALLSVLAQMRNTDGRKHAEN